MKRTSLLLFVLVSWAASAPADAPEPIRLLGKTALTPDGATLVFAWRGDIWRAPTGGGDARRLTFHPARDARPVVSRDGTTIAFQSNRSGSNQVFLMPLDGGSPRRITTHTEGSEPLDFYPDDKGVLYSGSRDHFWRRAGRLYFKRTELRTASVLVFDDYARDATLTADGRHIAFTREGTAWWRKQYTGSQASQIWIYDTAARAFTRMTDGTHEERWPLWHPNGKAIYYVSQQSGANNLYLRDLDSGHVEQLTHYTDDGVLFPSISRDGSTLVYRHLFDLYRMDLRRGGSAQKLPLSYGGDPIHDPQRRTMLNRANQVAFSEDGREVVFASGGDLWVMDTELREPVQLTATSEEERDPAFAPDFSAIVFVSDAGGHPDLHKLERADPKKHWWQGREFKRTALTSDAAVERAPRFTPDGRVSFLKERGDLWTMKPDGSDARVLLKGWNAPSYSFSPDGQWLAYAVNDNDFNRDIWVRKADGSGDPVNVSRHPDWESNPTWSPDGKLLAFTGQRSHDESDIYYVWLQQDEHDRTQRDRKIEKAIEKMKGRRDPAMEAKKPEKAKKPTLGIGRWIGGIFPDPKKSRRDKNKKKPAAPVKIDFEDITDRIQRIAIPDATERGLMFSPDSKKLGFVAKIDGRDGLYTVEIPDEMKPKFVAARPGAGGRWLAEGKQIVWLVNGVPSSTAANGKTTPYAFRSAHTIDLPARNRAAFIAAWRTMRDNWYDERLNNRDWEAVREKYESIAAATHTERELSQVVSMMLGELNGSHLGFFARGTPWTRPGWRDQTAHFGARFVESHPGPGWKVRDVVDGTPAAKGGGLLKAGEIVTHVDGKEIDAKVDPAIYLTGNPDRDVALQVKGEDGKERRVVIRPSTFGRVRRAMYGTWIDQCRAHVDRLSKNTLGYLHVRGMNWGSFEKFEAELYKIGHGKEGLVIDVRENGGGFTADHLLTCLCQPVHAVTVPRGGGRGYPQDRIVYARWSKPIVVLCNQNSFSNAEIFAHAIRSLKRGRIVGVPTAGGVISTGGRRIMGFAMLRLPFRGWFVGPTGDDMERKGCVPDAVIWPAPEEWPRGGDRQLDTAVKFLLDDVAAAKAKPRVRLRRASER